MDETIRLKELFVILRKRMAMILVITIGATLLSGIASFYFMTPIYQNSTQILVKQNKEDAKSIQYNDVQADLQLTNTYKGILKSHIILDQVKKQLGLNIKINELNKKISIGNEKDSQIIVVTVQDKDAKLARDIANTTVEIFKTEINRIMNVDNVTILSKAEITEGQAPIKPNKMLNVAIACIVGLMSSVGIAFLLDYLDNTIKKEKDIEELLDVPVIGVVSRMEETGSNSSRLSQVKRGGGHTIGS
ncbi:Wzz/FepE/Etk N-terminal domain-containing protein [Bacillus toyonensis]|uniref:YveK family protein n=1 Tax=Bacillus toyonensis TaxID=155322 RepID=UPI002DBC3BF1|nr:Wzz/FepE/Etk N-terminal domain-containing protein [Bacillus toyonensis]MEC2395196.1 Wzz/FepE/Etk N-terminal domain-containing protein [Bacillus toyonensis]